MFGGNEWIIIVIVALVLFGGSQIPKLARSLGQAQKEFKQGIAEGADEESTSGSDTSKDASDQKK
jgi:sec-independent protein translocase protein TatA